MNPSNYGKSDLRYWESKVRFQSATKSKTYSVQIQHDKRRSWVGLGTRDRERAAISARDLYLDIVANGWDLAMARRQGPRPEKRSNVTIGEYLQLVEAKALVYPKSLISYAAALRKIAADIAGIRHSAPRPAWRQRVDALPLAMLTTAAIEKWRAQFIKRGSTNPLAERSAKISAQSFVARARALFGERVLPRVKEFVELPNPAPFHGIRIGKTRPQRYRATFDMATLVQAAKRELPAEQMKIFLLAGLAGLRRNEIDKLPWSAFRWDEGIIRVEATEFFRPKARESESDIMVDSELFEVFRGYHAMADGPFVVNPAVMPDPAASYEQYRCHRDFVELIGWLRARGVVSRTPLHALRKEYGSTINQRHGLMAASAMLRHASIKTTVDHYVEQRHRAVSGYGALLIEDGPTIVSIERSA